MRNHLVFLPLAGLVVAACSSVAETNWGSTRTKIAPVDYTGFHGHSMPTVAMARAARNREAKGAKSANTPALETGTLAYFGGKVISTVKLQAIYWGNSGSYQAQLDPFLQGVSGTGFLGWLGEYDTNTQTIGGGTWLGSYVDTTAPSGVTIDDSQIQAELVSLINAGSVPAPDANTLYFFFFPSGVNITLSGQGSSCSTFCGYHDTIASGASELFYGVLPDPATCGTACDNQSGNYFADLTSVTTHELTEAITDPEVGIAIANAGSGGTYPTFPNGWASPSGGSEIGDLCAWQQGTYGGYNVQLEWSDAANACIDPNAGATDDGGVVDSGTDTGTGGDGGVVDGGTDTGTGNDGGGVDGGTDTGTGNDGGTVDAGGSCAHDLCSAGVALQASCDPCATQICATDPYCCATTWDDICTGEVSSVCGETCSSGDAGSGGDGGTVDAGTPGCDHGICATGDALDASCDPCASTICASDSYCCSTAWDAICLSEVTSICGQSCP